MRSDVWMFHNWGREAQFMGELEWKKMNYEFGKVIICLLFLVSSPFSSPIFFFSLIKTYQNCTDSKTKCSHSGNPSVFQLSIFVLTLWGHNHFMVSHVLNFVTCWVNNGRFILNFTEDAEISFYVKNDYKFLVQASTHEVFHVNISFLNVSELENKKEYLCACLEVYWFRYCTLKFYLIFLLIQRQLNWVREFRFLFCSVTDFEKQSLKCCQRIMWKAFLK